MIAQCGNCAHWKSPLDPMEDDIDDSVGFGRCLAIKHYPGHDQTMIENADAFVQDASGYKADLYTRPDFCCTLHEKKP